MIFLLISISIHAVWGSGSSLSDQVHQTPAALIKNLGDSAELNCIHEIQGYNRILWYKQSNTRELVYLGYMLATSSYPEAGFQITGNANEGQTCTLTIVELSSDSSAVYFCAATDYQAYFGPGTKLTVLDPNISDTAIPPTNVRVLPPSKHECKDAQERKNKKTLVCVATGFYPDHVSVSWSINGQNQTEGVGTDTSAVWNNKTEKYSITSRLRVAAELWYTQDNQFTCTVLFFDGTQNLPITAEINGETAQSNRGMKTENYVKSTQTAKLAYLVFVAKSSLYGVFVVFFIWKLQGASGKQFT